MKITNAVMSSLHLKGIHWGRPLYWFTCPKCGKNSKPKETQQEAIGEWDAHNN